MKLHKIILAAILALCSQTQADTVKENKQGKLNLALKFGSTFQLTGRRSEDRRVSFAVDEYLIEVQFRKESSIRESDEETLLVGDLIFTGRRQFRAYQGNVVFGYSFFGLQRPYIDARIYGHVTGGIQLEKVVMKLEDQKIPNDIRLDILLGGGARAEVSYPLSHKIPLRFVRSLEVGLGTTVDYLSPQIDIPEDLKSRVYLSAYGFLGISKRH